jgi:hypothetical protein
LVEDARREDSEVLIRVGARQVLRLVAAVALTAVTLCLASSAADADDGYDLPFAQAVRTATGGDRLLVWARNDGYVQSTDYVPRLGFMYTNHDRFDPPDLAHPTVLIFDQAGRLVACEYQFRDGAVVPAAFKSVPAGAWYEIPRHLHYNVQTGARTYYEQAEWPTEDEPTVENLRKRNMLPADGTLLFAFVHPKTRSVIVWAWLPNGDGLFAGENSLLP